MWDASTLITQVLGSNVLWQFTTSIIFFIIVLGFILIIWAHFEYVYNYNRYKIVRKQWIYLPFIQKFNLLNFQFWTQRNWLENMSFSSPKSLTIAYLEISCNNVLYSNMMLKTNTCKCIRYLVLKQRKRTISRALKCKKKIT